MARSVFVPVLKMGGNSCPRKIAKFLSLYQLVRDRLRNPCPISCPRQITESLSYIYLSAIDIGILVIYKLVCDKQLNPCPISTCPRQIAESFFYNKMSDSEILALYQIFRDIQRYPCSLSAPPTWRQSNWHSVLLFLTTAGSSSKSWKVSLTLRP